MKMTETWVDQFVSFSVCLFIYVFRCIVFTRHVFNVHLLFYCIDEPKKRRTHSVHRMLFIEYEKNGNQQTKKKKKTENLITFSRWWWSASKNNEIGYCLFIISCANIIYLGSVFVFSFVCGFLYVFFFTSFVPIRCRKYRLLCFNFLFALSIAPSFAFHCCILTVLWYVIKWVLSIVIDLFRFSFQLLWLFFTVVEMNFFGYHMIWMFN